MPVLFPTFTTLAAELGDSSVRTLQKILGTLREVRVPVSGTALASAARTVSTLSADIPTSGYRCFSLYVNVTAVPGLGGLRVGLVVKDPVTNTYRTLVQSTNAITATGMYVFQFGPGLGTLNGSGFSVNQCALHGVALGSVVQVLVFPSTADSYTYSATYELIP